MSLSNYSENILLNWLLTNDAAPTRPTAWYVQLHMTDPTDTGTAGTQPTIITNDYDRKPITGGMSTATVGTCTNEANISWTANAAAATYTFTHISIWDALTGGNCLFVGEIGVPELVAANGVLTFPIGKIMAILE